MADYVEMSSALKFLIIDSEHSTATQLRQDLVKIGYRNSTIIDEELKALDYIRKEPTDFIFCRQNLPKMMGTELLEELKNDYNVPRKPFLAFMEKGQKDDVALMVETGADNLLLLPYNIKDLAERVTNGWSKYTDKNNPDMVFEQGRRLLLQAKYPEAEQAFRSLIERKTLIPQAKIGQIRCRLLQRQTAEALQLANGLALDFPNFVLAHHWQGEAQVASGNALKAVASFEKAIGLSPKNPMRYQRVAQILTENNQWDAIVPLLKQAEERKLSYNFVEEGLAKALIKLGRKEEAIEYYRILVRRNPRTADYCNNIAVCYKALKNFNKAIQYINQGLEVDPQNCSILFNLALIWAEKGKTDKAIERLEEVLKIDPGFEKAKTKLAQLRGGGSEQKKTA